MKKVRAFYVGLILLVCAAFIVAWQFRNYNTSLDAQAPRSLTPEEIDWALESQADSALLAKCTNVVGYSRAVSHYAFTTGAVTNWKGDADVDFVNKVGGVERTNLLFRFFASGTNLFCEEDTWGMREREEKREAQEAELRKKIDAELNPVVYIKLPIISGFGYILGVKVSNPAWLGAMDVDGQIKGVDYPNIYFPSITIHVGSSHQIFEVSSVHIWEGGDDVGIATKYAENLLDTAYGPHTKMIKSGADYGLVWTDTNAAEATLWFSAQGMLLSFRDDRYRRGADSSALPQ